MGIEEVLDPRERGFTPPLFFPIRHELGPGRQIGDLLRNLVRVRLIVAGQDQERRIALTDEVARDVVDEVLCIEIARVGVEDLVGCLGGRVSLSFEVLESQVRNSPQVSHSRGERGSWELPPEPNVRVAR